MNPPFVSTDSAPPSGSLQNVCASLEAWPTSHLCNTIHCAKPIPSVPPYSPHHQYRSAYQHHCHVTLPPVSHCRLHHSTSLYSPQHWSWSPNVTCRPLLLNETNVTQRHHASQSLIAACTPQCHSAVLNVGPQSPNTTLHPHQLLLLNETMPLNVTLPVSQCCLRPSTLLPTNGTFIHPQTTLPLATPLIACPIYIHHFIRHTWQRTSLDHTHNPPYSPPTLVVLHHYIPPPL